MDLKDPREMSDYLFGPGDEEKEACIHCGKVWYAIHHKDGVCHECQKRGLPGKTVLARRAQKMQLMLITLVIVALCAFIYFLFSFWEQRN